MKKLKLFSLALMALFATSVWADNFVAADIVKSGGKSSNHITCSSGITSTTNKKVKNTSNIACVAITAAVDTAINTSSQWVQIQADENYTIDNTIIIQGAANGGDNKNIAVVMWRGDYNASSADTCFSAVAPENDSSTKDKIEVSFPSGRFRTIRLYRRINYKSGTLGQSASGSSYQIPSSDASNFNIQSISATATSAATYTVTYKAGEGTGSDVVDSDAKTVKAFTDCSFTAPSGYEFKEWQDAGSNVVAAGATVSSDMTLTAIYRLIPTKYTVTYSLNGASGDAPTETNKAEGDVFNLAAAPSWAGHAFDGWLCSADAAVKAAGSSYTMTAANTTFTAQWHEVDCKIYSLTGAIGSAEVTADASNAEVTSSLLKLASNNARIKLTPAEGSFKAGDIITISGTIGNTSKKFGAIVYAEDGSTQIAEASISGSTSPLIATATLTADAEYVFLKRADGTTENFTTFEVHRSCAEGTAAGLSYATASVEKTMGDAAFTNSLTNANGLVVLYSSSNTAVATVAANGQVTLVSDGEATITAYSAVQTQSGTLYAAGSASYTLTVNPAPTYTITYDLNGGSGTTPTQADQEAGAVFTLHDGVTGITAPANKTFLKWKDQDDNLFLGGAEYTMPAKAVTLTAQWAGDTYTVTYKDGTTDLGSETVEVGSHPLGIEAPEKPYYEFAAWQLSGSDVELDDVTGAKDEEVTLTARYAGKYASSINIEQWVLDNGKKNTDFRTLLGDKKYIYSNINDLDSLDDEKDNRNYAFLGQKLKASNASISFLLKSGSTVKVRFGNVGADFKIYEGETANTKTSSQLSNATTSSSNVYSYTAAADIIIKIENVTNNKTLVVKQIMIDEDIASITLPDTPTALDNTDVNAKAVKRLENGILVIEKNGRLFNAQGQLIK